VPSPSLSSSSVVCSWNEWDSLREVIVGTARGATEPAYEPAFAPYCRAGDQGRAFAGGPVPAHLIDEAEKQLDAFAQVLSDRGITVRRPDPVDHAVPTRTPDWEAPFGRANACPRDLLLVVGDEIIEAPMAQRARFFEYRAYRTLLAEYFRGGARWTAVPKPLMADSLYDERARNGSEAFDYAVRPLLTEVEPAFDAASFVRFGRDIFWQPDLVSNQLGAEWLQRHLGPGFRVHRIGFREALPTHVGTTLVPIRPGIVLVNPARPCTDGAIDIFTRNGWRVIDAPVSTRTGAASRDVSSWISMNVLMLDPHTVVVERSEKPMIALLESLDCDVIPCAFDRVYPFGGSFHCCTTDIRRDGTLESYFPESVPSPSGCCAGFAS
jgi:glycine amidinotransferase